MNKERLEEIEGKYTILPVSSKQDGFEYTEVVVEDLVFLIQNGFKQAERVQELEDIIYQDERQAVLEGMYEQNKRYREAREIIEQVYKENYVRNSYGYEDGYLDGLDTAMSIIDKALEESS